MCITEGLNLRVKDIDFVHRTIIVREGKGGKDRALMLPESLIELHHAQLARTNILWAKDRKVSRFDRYSYMR